MKLWTPYYKGEPSLTCKTMLVEVFTLHKGVTNTLLSFSEHLQSGWSALMAAVYNCHNEIALRLIEAGATPDLEDKVATYPQSHN